jgi:hypothetical protein
MPITGDFAKLDRFAQDVGSLEGAPVRAARAAVPRVEAALRQHFAPGQGNGWAPGLTVTAGAVGLTVDSGGPARCPDGIPEDVVAPILEDALAEELSK